MAEKTPLSQSFDENRFEAMFKAEFRGLCIFAISYLKDSEAAKDIVHSAFVALWEKRETIDVTKSYKSYLTTTIKNKCLNYLRDNKKFYSGLDNIEHYSDDYVVEQTNSLERDELDARIHSAINELPVRCKEIFELNRFEQLKYHEVAEKLGISIKTVESQMSKALQHLRNKLVDYLYVGIMVFLLILVNV